MSTPAGGPDRSRPHHQELGGIFDMTGVTRGPDGIKHYDGLPRNLVHMLQAAQAAAAGGCRLGQRSPALTDIGGAVPMPGDLGVVEAGLIGGLTSAACPSLPSAG